MSEYIVQGSTLTNLVNPVKKYEAKFIDNIDSALPIHPMFFETVDERGNSSIPYEANNLKTTWIMHHDSLVDNDGRRRLVLYKEETQEGEPPPQGYDEYESLFYEGSEIIDDVVYDKWRKIETGPNDVRYTWESSERCYYYTIPLTKSVTILEVPELITNNFVKPERRISTDKITPQKSSQTLERGTYLEKDLVIEGDQDLVSSNIKQGVTLFGVQGSFAYEPIQSFNDTIEHTGGSKTYDITNMLHRASWILIASGNENLSAMQLIYTNKYGNSQRYSFNLSNLPARVIKVGTRLSIIKQNNEVKFEELPIDYEQTTLKKLIKSTSSSAESSVTYSCEVIE